MHVAQWFLDKRQPLSMCFYPMCFSIFPIWVASVFSDLTPFSQNLILIMVNRNNEIEQIWNFNFLPVMYSLNRLYDPKLWLQVFSCTIILDTFLPFFYSAIFNPPLKLDSIKRRWMPPPNIFPTCNTL